MGSDRLHLPAKRLIALAVLLGMLAGGVAVYVTGGMSGNLPTRSAATTQADAACQAKADLARTLGREAKGDVAAMLAADPPQSLAFLAFNGPEGRPVTIADRSGKTLLVNLWATWCAPCRAEMPALDALQERKGSDAFEVVAINVDTGDDAKPRKFLDETGVKTLAYYRDGTMGVFNALKERALALGLPVTLLVDPQGCLLTAMNGPADWSGDDAMRFVDAAVSSAAGAATDAR